MTASFTCAILKAVPKSFAQGLSTSGEGPPDVALAQRQHAAYAQALEDLGLTVTVLAADADHPDSVFIEDAAVIVGDLAVITRPGALSRREETVTVADHLRPILDLVHISAPGTLDGGDVCETDEGLLVGVGARTNAEGARQLAEIVRPLGLACQSVDLSGLPDLLHLKTGISYLGEGRMAVAPMAAALPVLRDFETVPVHADEAYAANCVRIGQRVVLPAGSPRFADRLAALGLEPVAVDLSEFRKMDGGPSCLSLRF